MSERRAQAATRGTDERQAAKLRLHLVAVFLIAAALVGLAAVVERRPAAVVLKLQASEFAFTLVEPLKLYEIPATTVQVAGVSTMRAVVSRVEQLRKDASPSDERAWLATPLAGPLTLTPLPERATFNARLNSNYTSVDLDLAAQTRLRVAADESDARSLRLEAVGGRLDAKIMVDDRAVLLCDGCRLDTGEPQSTLEPAGALRLSMRQRGIDVEPGGGAVVVSFRAAGANDAVSLLPANRRIKAQKVEFWRLTDGRAESTLVDDGHIVFEGSKSAPEVLRRGDVLRLECEAPADLRLLHVGAKSRVEVGCDASVLRTGTEDGARSRLPSYLRWWYTNDTVALLVGAVLSLTAAILGVLQRFGLLVKAG